MQMKEQTHKYVDKQHLFCAQRNFSIKRNAQEFMPELDAEPYQPHSIPPIGGASCHRGPKIQPCHHLAPQRKLRSPKLKYEALEVNEVKGTSERKVLMHYSYLGSFESKVFTHYNCWGMFGGPLKAKYWGRFESKVACWGPP